MRSVWPVRTWGNSNNRQLRAGKPLLWGATLHAISAVQIAAFVSLTSAVTFIVAQMMCARLLQEGWCESTGQSQLQLESLKTYIARSPEVRQGKRLHLMTKTDSDAAIADLSSSYVGLTAALDVDS